MKKGLPSGGDFQDKSGCLPYTIPSESAKNHFTNYENKRYVCPTSCSDGSRLGNEIFSKTAMMKHVQYTPVANSDIEKIKRHLMLHGPLAFIFQLSNKFTYYKGGDKVLSEDRFDAKGLTGGKHWVIVGGWGRQNGQDYRFVRIF